MSRKGTELGIRDPKLEISQKPRDLPAGTHFSSLSLPFFYLWKWEQSLPGVCP